MSTPAVSHTEVLDTREVVIDAIEVLAARGTVLGGKGKGLDVAAANLLELFLVVAPASPLNDIPQLREFARRVIDGRPLC